MSVNDSWRQRFLSHLLSVEHVTAAARAASVHPEVCRQWLLSVTPVLLAKSISDVAADSLAENQLLTFDLRQRLAEVLDQAPGGLKWYEVVEAVGLHRHRHAGAVTGELRAMQSDGVAHSLHPGDGSHPSVRVWRMGASPKWRPRQVLSVPRITPLSSKPGEGYVYFIRAGKTNSVKIGFAVEPKKRLSSIQIGTPHRLALLHTIKGPQALERFLHRLFRKRRLGGEWFSIPETEWGLVLSEIEDAFARVRSAA